MIISDHKENYQTGWIKLYRSLMNKGWYKKGDYVRLWIHLLLKANHIESYKFWFNGEDMEIKSGQFITGRKALNRETGIPESKIERILSYFEKNEQQIEQQKTNKNRLISILNWHLYQGSEQQIEQPVNNKRTTSEQPVDTYKNDKNDKNIKNQNDLNKMVSKIVNKEIKDSQIIDALKKHSIPGNIAMKYYKDHSMSFLIKKIWHFRYILENRRSEIKNEIGYLRGLIEYDKYPEPDKLYEFIKEKQAKYKDGDFKVLYKGI